MVEPLEAELRALGLHLRTDWVRACVVHLRSLDPSFDNQRLENQVEAPHFPLFFFGMSAVRK
jgi:hypothetical protein